MVPLDKGESVSKYVAQVLDLVDQSGLAYRFTPIATIVEGEFEKIIELIRACHLSMREQSRRVITTIKIDDREGATSRLTGKIESVEKHLGRELKK